MEKFTAILLAGSCENLADLREMLEQSGRFQIVAQFTDSEPVLESIYANEPDLVLMEMNVPNASSLDLIRQTADIGIRSAFVIVNGEDDLVCVRRAILAGAIEYFLPPHNERERVVMVNLIVARMNEYKREIETKMYSFLMGSEYDDMLPAHMRDGKYDKYQAITMRADHPEWLRDRLQAHSRSLEIRLGQRRYLMLINCDRDMGAEIAGLLEDGDAEKAVEFVGVSECGEETKAIPRLVRHAIRASMTHDFVSPKKRFYQFREADRKKVLDIASEILAQMNQGDDLPIDSMVDQVKSYFVQNDLMLDDCMLMYNYLTVAMAGRETQGQPVANTPPVMDMYDFTDSYEDIGEVIVDLLARSRTETNENEKAIGAFDKMLRYINEHYGEEIQLRKLSAMFYINYSYCCELFQKRLGMTFTKYLTSLRMEKACQLLEEADLSIYQVSEAVGIKDYFYFNKLFKRTIGETPAHYRAMTRMKSETRKRNSGKS